MKNDPDVLATPEYRRFVEELKARGTAARISAARHVNRDMILLYWDIGRSIEEKQKILGWGESVIDRISKDLRAAFPATTGFSPRNLRDMKRLYLAYTDAAIWRQPVAKLGKSTGSRGLLIRRQPVAELASYGKYLQDRVNLNSAEIVQFLQQLVSEIPWGHNLLILNKLTDPVARLYYLRATAHFGWSRSVLLNQIKARAYAGKMDFYLNLLNDKERSPDDKPSIGIILCAEKDDIEVEYARRTKANPIGVATYQLQSKLPPAMKGKLPSARQLRAAVRRALPEKNMEGKETL